MREALKAAVPLVGRDPERRMLASLLAACGATPTAEPTTAPAAELPRSTHMAVWEANLRTFVLRAGVATVLAALLLPFAFPLLMTAVRGAWRWTWRFGLWGRCLLPALLVGTAWLLAFVLLLFPGPYRSALDSFGVGLRYFEPAALTGVVFEKQGLLFGLGDAQPLGVQAGLLVAFPLVTTLLGFLAARLAYRLLRPMTPAGRGLAAAQSVRRAA